MNQYIVNGLIASGKGCQVSGRPGTSQRAYRLDRHCSIVLDSESTTLKGVMNTH